MRIVEVIEAERQRQKIPKAELARRAGLQRPHVSRILGGVVAPGAHTLEKLAGGLGRPLILGGPEFAPSVPHAPASGPALAADPNICPDCGGSDG